MACNNDGLTSTTDTSQCPACGSNEVSTAIIEEQVAYGSGPNPIQLRVRIPVHRCAACELEFTANAAEELRHEAVCRHLGLLTPKDVLAIRAKYGLSRQRFADITRLGVATLARWESGDVVQNAALDAYLRLVAKPEIYYLIKSGALSDLEQRTDSKTSDLRSSDRFPTLAANGDIPLRLKRSETFKLAPCTTDGASCM